MHCRSLLTKKSFPRVRRSGFTLIEVLTVIAIIGILVGLLLPAISAVRRRMSNAAMVFEIKNVEQSIEAYKNKFGDYPPDGSNSAVLIRHLRKAFPSIAQSEISLLTNIPDGHGEFPGTGQNLFNFSNGAPDGIMDPPEALVFFLGGFSDDPVFPISGEGGPLFISNDAGARIDSSAPVNVRHAIQYNPTRSNAIHDFGNGALAVEVVANGNGEQFTISNDELTLFGSTANDVIPTYAFSRSVGPICYFDSRTYAYDVSGGRYFNFYSPAGGGTARPYKSGDINTTIVWTTGASLRNKDMHFKYVNEKSFQLIAAGLDENYGGLTQGQDDDAPIFYKYPSGEQLNILTQGGGSGFSRYKESADQPSSQLDNIVNFSDSVLEDAIDE